MNTSNVSNHLTYKAALGVMLLQQQLGTSGLPRWRLMNYDQKVKALYLAETYIHLRRTEERVSVESPAAWRKRTKWRPRKNR